MHFMVKQNKNSTITLPSEGREDENEGKEGEGMCVCGGFDVEQLGPGVRSLVIICTNAQAAHSTCAERPCTNSNFNTNYS